MIVISRVVSVEDGTKLKIKVTLALHADKFMQVEFSLLFPTLISGGKC